MTSHPITVKISPARRIGDGEPCFVIAEIGSNHNHDFAVAVRLIDAAADAGVDAVKFQTFRADSHYSKFAPGFSYLNNRSPHELIKSLEIDRAWHAPLQKHAESRGVVFFSSPCDVEAIDELDALGVPAFKVASYDLTDLSLIRHMARTGRPILLSTGLADWMDIQRAVDACRQEGNEQIVLLQCTSLYPAPAHLSNLRAITVMREAFGVLTGYSDHTDGDHVCVAAVALGACVVEKHVTLDKTMAGPDHSFAIEPAGVKNMVRRIRDVEAAIGDGAKTGPRAEEREMFEKGRRSLHAASRIAKGEIITSAMLTSKRPGLGIPPHLVDVVVGRTARLDIEPDQWITWEMI
jgi:sialic acid synthase SpsE